MVKSTCSGGPRPVSFKSPLLPLALAAFLTACAQPQPALAQAPAKAKAMVAAANPMAVEAGLKVLRAGGTAADAAVAVQATLGLVEPQSSGLGGGAFMTYYDAKTKQVTGYNGRETAPMAATPKLFYGEDGKPLGRMAAILSGRSTGAPGAIAMLSLAQSQHGKLAWKDLFGEAERLADGGFPVPRRMANAAAGKGGQAATPDAVAYFTKPDGTKVQAGEIMRNPAYAASVRKIAAEGPKGLLEGAIAEAIVAKVHEGPIPGELSLADLKAYKPQAKPGLCRPYRAYIVCVPNAPSGGPAVLEALGILQHTDIGKHRNDVEGWYLFSQASRLMYADRDRYIGDPDFVDVPVEGLLDPAYLAERAKLIGPSAAATMAPGKPKGAGPRAPDATKEVSGTTHLVIVDQWGNVVSMTTTVESVFGSGRMVGGFFLNNQLTDFSFSPEDRDGAPAANAVAPGKRPRSSMAPAIVLDKKGAFVAAVGSPGGPSILAYNLKALVGMLDWKLSVQDAINLPNLIAGGSFYAAEADKFSPDVVAGLEARGIKLTSGFGAEGSGLHGIEVTPNGLRGGADPRREGVAKAP
ncbi:MAG: gamma-glutamyltransferase family protein [Alphaproteobacteria bacterium]|nr:gamma-glutamyltransferase family protein [Alphaproteobacteria bacterium]MBU1514562.1 gamma-glutamyltransferase family protein [Alphaproteobacteria bacterium]MBU2096806.1 gamma-glutamyltransferase family protein [Alphaproteobacteria bacterium]MBU2153433.1 gamma-glutamyltransferase family protein [Alphaproteobacteria bacterium]MBU2306062.1 gamma-glutamyltransferase family protein [Alphaproteobacteria bacterium]